MVWPCLPKVENFCCCLPLRLGAFIAAQVTVAMAGYTAYTGAGAISKSCEAVVNKHTSFLNIFGVTLFKILEYMKYGTSSALVFAGGYLLKGVCSEDTKATCLYVFVGFISTSLDVMITGGLMAYMSNDYKSCTSSFYLVLPSSFFPGLLSYFIVIVNSYEYQIKEERKRREEEGEGTCTLY